MPLFEDWSLFKIVTTPNTPLKALDVPGFSHTGAFVTTLGQVTVGVGLGVAAYGVLAGSLVARVISPVDLPADALEFTANVIGDIANLVGDTESISWFNDTVWGHDTTEWF